MVRDLHFDEIDDWIKTRRSTTESLVNLLYIDKPTCFDAELQFLNLMLGEGYAGTSVSMVNQRKLPLNNPYEYLDAFFNTLLDGGGEGIMVRDPALGFNPKREHGILKCKPSHDDEAVVTGFTSGAKTDKGSKLLGMIGALITEYNGKRLELAGLTNEEREFDTWAMAELAEALPGTDMPNDTQGKQFKVGDTVTFKYRELSDDGIPKDARYWRKR
jgi:DNA ligase-1